MKYVPLTPGLQAVGTGLAVVDDDAELDVETEFVDTEVELEVEVGFTDEDVKLELDVELVEVEIEVEPEVDVGDNELGLVDDVAELVVRRVLVVLT